MHSQGKEKLFGGAGAHSAVHYTQQRSCHLFSFLGKSFSNGVLGGYFILPFEQSKHTLSLEQLGGNGAPLSFYFEHGDVIEKGKKSVFWGGGGLRPYLFTKKK